MRQCGQSVVGARSVTTERDRRAIGTGRQPLAAHPAVVDRECDAGRPAWSARDCLSSLDQRWIAGGRRLGTARSRPETRLACARLYAGALVADGDHLRDCACVARDQSRFDTCAQGQFAWFERGIAFAVEQITGDSTGCAVIIVAGRSGIIPAHAAQPATSRAGIQYAQLAPFRHTAGTDWVQG